MPSKDSSHKNSVCKSPSLCMRMDVSIRGEHFWKSASLNCLPHCILFCSPTFKNVFWERESALTSLYLERACDHLNSKCISLRLCPLPSWATVWDWIFQSSLLSSCSTLRCLDPSFSFHSSVYSRVYSLFDNYGWYYSNCTGFSEGIKLLEGKKKASTYFKIKV